MTGAFGYGGLLLRRLFPALCFAAVVAAALALPAAAVAAEECADGMLTKEAAVLYDSHSTKAGRQLILSGHYPLRRISFVSGWCKVLLPGGENGWVRARHLRPLRAAMVLGGGASGSGGGGAVVRADPVESAPGVFFANGGVVLEVLGRARPGWWQVLHADGETGYVAAGEVWVNF